MNRHTRNGLVGLVATLIPNTTLCLTLPDIFAAPLTGGWWHMWFPLYVVWLGCIAFGIAGRKHTDSHGDGKDLGRQS